MSEVQPGEAGICGTCGGEGRIDLNAGWHGPPGVERHHWHPCPDCDGPAMRPADPASALRAVLRHPEAREALREMLTSAAAVEDARRGYHATPLASPGAWTPVDVFFRNALSAAVDALASGDGDA